VAVAVKLLLLVLSLLLNDTETTHSVLRWSRLVVRWHVLFRVCFRFCFRL
jgi:hypothetical protein